MILSNGFKSMVSSYEIFLKVSFLSIILVLSTALLNTVKDFILLNSLVLLFPDWNRIRISFHGFNWSLCRLVGVIAAPTFNWEIVGFCFSDISFRVLIGGLYSEWMIMLRVLEVSVFVEINLHVRSHVMFMILMILLLLILFELSLLSLFLEFPLLWNVTIKHLFAKELKALLDHSLTWIKCVLDLLQNLMNLLFGNLGVLAILYKRYKIASVEVSLRFLVISTHKFQSLNDKLSEVGIWTSLFVSNFVNNFLED